MEDEKREQEKRDSSIVNHEQDIDDEPGITIYVHWNEFEQLKKSKLLHSFIQLSRHPKYAYNYTRANKMNTIQYS